MKEATHRCEVLVVGSGPGGATTACLLAEAGLDVLVVEEGSDFPVDSAPSHSRLEMDQKYRAGGLNPAHGQPRITYVEGRCVGGASEVNAGLYCRPSEEMLDAWRRCYRIEDFEPNSLAPHFTDCERELHASLRPAGVSRASSKLCEGTRKLGWEAEEIPKLCRYERRSDGHWVASRQTMKATMIPRALAAGCRLLPRTRIRKIVGETGRRGAALGWTCGNDGSQAEVRIRFDWVFVCAGAVGSAALLRRSGFKKRVGDSLTLNPMLRLAARFEEPVNEPAFGVPVHQVSEFKPDLTLGCSHSSLAHLGLWLDDRVPDRNAKLEAWSKLAIFYATIRTPARGSVRNLPLLDEPLVRYSSGAGDRERLAEGVSRLGRVLFAAGAVELYGPVEDWPPATSQPELERRLSDGLPIRGVHVTALHLHSSCPMSGTPELGAVDSWGRVHGATHVFVNDVSILPESPGINPQGTTMAIARRNARRFLESRG